MFPSPHLAPSSRYPFSRGIKRRGQSRENGEKRDMVEVAKTSDQGCSQEATWARTPRSSPASTSCPRALRSPSQTPSRLRTSAPRTRTAARGSWVRNGMACTCPPSAGGSTTWFPGWCSRTQRWGLSPTCADSRARFWAAGVPGAGFWARRR